MKRVMMVWCVLVLTACGGGGGSNSDDSPASSNEAKGVYRGATDTGRTLLAVVLDSGESYFFLGAEGGGYDAVEGLVHGVATAARGGLSIAPARRFYLDGDGEPVLAVSVEATYVQGQYLTGQVVDDQGEAMGFTSAPDGDVVANLDDLEGVYAGGFDTVAGTQFTTIEVGADGALTGRVSVEAYCSFSGAVVPKAEGMAFNLSISFDDPDCLYDGQTLGGILFHDRENERIYIAALKSDRSAGVFFYGGYPR